MKILSIVETAYRGTLEEQDDAALWITHALRNAGADISVLLRGNAVCYAAVGHDPSGVTIGGLGFDHPPVFENDLAKMKKAGISLRVVHEDLEARGIPQEAVCGSIQVINRSDVAAHLMEFDHVWHW